MTDWNDSWATIDWSKEEGIAEKIQTLIEQGATIDAVDKYGDTPLMYAVKNENLKAFEKILAYDQDLNAQNKWGRTALMRAAIVDNSQMVEMLSVKEGVNPDIQDEDGMTALMFASMNDNQRMIVALEAAKANLEIEDKNGFRALDWAVSNKSRKAAFAIKYPHIFKRVQANGGR